LNGNKLRKLQYITALFVVVLLAACFGTKPITDPYESKNIEVLEPETDGGGDESTASTDNGTDGINEPEEGENNSEGGTIGEIPEKPDTVFTIEPEYVNYTTNTVDILVLMPFNSHLNNFDYSDKRIDAKSKMALEVYNGMITALRELKRDGLSCNVKIYDTRIDAFRTQSLLQSLSHEQFDLVIGPAYSKCLKVAAKWAKENQTYLISPVATNVDFVKDNPYFISMNPSSRAHTESLLTYLLGDIKVERINIVTDANSFKDIKLAESIEVLCREMSVPGPTGLVDSLAINMIHDTNETIIKTKKEREKEVSLLESFLDKDMPNYVLVASYNEIFSTDVVRRLNMLKSEYEIHLIGMPNWRKFKNINIDMLNDLGFICTSAVYDNDEDIVQEVFSMNYNANIGYKPTEYAKKSYDITKFVLTTMKNVGVDLNLSFNEPELLSNGAFMNFDIQPIYADSSACQYFENKALHILQFEDYSFTKQK